MQPRRYTARKRRHAIDLPIRSPANMQLAGLSEELGKLGWELLMAHRDALFAEGVETVDFQ